MSTCMMVGINTKDSAIVAEGVINDKYSKSFFIPLDLNKKYRVIALFRQSQDSTPAVNYKEWEIENKSSQKTASFTYWCDDQTFLSPLVGTQGTEKGIYLFHDDYVYTGSSIHYFVALL